MFVDGLEFSSSNYDQRVYYKGNERDTIVVSHAVDDFTIFTSSLDLKKLDSGRFLYIIQKLPFNTNWKQYQE